MRKVLVLRIHPDTALVRACLVRFELCFECIQVALVVCHLERTYIEDALFAVLVRLHCNKLKTYGIVKTLLVDNILYLV